MIRQNLLKIALLFLLVVPDIALATKYNYVCKITEEPFSPGIAFSFDGETREIKIIENYGYLPRPEERVGSSEISNNVLNFPLDYYADGYSEMRDVFSYHFKDRKFYVSRVFLNEDGSVSGRGLFGEGKCSKRSAVQSGAPSTNFRRAKPSPVTIEDAKLAIGFPPSMAKVPFATGADFRFGIVDAGYKGLDEWLEANPRFKKRVKYKSLQKDGKKSSSSHGFKVLKVALTIMPFSVFYIYETSFPVRDFKDIIEALKGDGVHFASMSLGIKQYMGGINPTEVYEQLDLLEKYQISFLVSAGNQRDDSHFFRYSDIDDDGRIEFSRQPSSKGKPVEHDYIYAGDSANLNLNLSWSEYPERVSDFELQLINKKGDIVAKASATGTKPVIKLWYKNETKRSLWIRVINNSETAPATDLKFGLFARGGNARHGFFNGQESMGIFAQHESPFLTVVGSFGIGNNGKLLPSNFSSLGHTDTGQIGPHVLGPGQFLIDEKVVNGTSFATPFIAALYSIYADYNVKNVIQATTSMDRLGPGLLPEETSRWGTPEANLIFSNPCSESNNIENMRSSVEDQKLVIEFELSRDCMEGLDYYLHAYVSGDVVFSAKAFRYERLKVASSPTQDVRGWVQKHSDTAVISAEPMRIEIPFKYIPRNQFGREVGINLRISTLAQWDPVQIVAETKLLTLTLPQPAPLAAKYLEGDVLKTAERALNGQYFYDTVELANLALGKTGITAEQDAKARDIRSMAVIGLRDIAALKAFTTEDAKINQAAGPAALRLGGILLAQGKPAEALARFETCLTSEGVLGLRCKASYTVAAKLSGGDARAKIANMLGSDLAGLATTDTVPAKALAVMLGKLSGGDFRDHFNRFAQANSGKPEAALAIGESFYYLGLMGIWSGNQSFARDSFFQSARSGSVLLEAALSDEWLKSLPE